jgi:protein-disulfide isomerase
MIKKVFVLILSFSILSFYSYCGEKKENKVEEDSNKLNSSIIEWIRFSYDIPYDVEMKVENIGSSEIQGINKVDVTFSKGKESETYTFYFTKDGKYLFLGKFVDLTKNPKKEVLSKISLENQVERGSKDAKVIIVEYSDFQCPYCSKINNTIEELLKEYNSKVRFIFKHFPLDFHQWAMDAAIASQCVWEQKKESFWKLSEQFYKNQNDITKENLKDKIIEFVKNEGLNIKDFESCFENKIPQNKIDKDISEAQNLGINSIPTVIINGTVIKGAQQIERYRKIIDNEISSDIK